MKGYFCGEVLEDIKPRNSNKFVEDVYTVSSSYYQFDDKNLSIMSDIHFHPHVPKDLYKLLVIYARRTKPDYIIMPGDMIETNDFINNIKEREFFEQFIKFLAEVCPLVMVPGNHEIHNLSVKAYFNKPNSKESIMGMNFLQSLTKYKNVYFLDNNQICLNGINFIGFSPTLGAYLGKDQRVVDTFFNDYNKYDFNIKDNEYNVFITHNPIPLTISDDWKYNSDFKKIDLVTTGHLHGGYMKRENPTRGLGFYPFMTSFDGIVFRGVQDFGRGEILISKGFRTWNADMLLFNLFEKICTNNVEKITLTKKKKI